mgnify:CR=1 FL=1
MSDYYVPDDAKDKMIRRMVGNYDVEDQSAFYEVTDTEFNIGPVYPDSDNAKKIRCRLCGGDHFYVGTESYYTAIKCVNCEWELCIHSG